MHKLFLPTGQDRRCHIRKNRHLDEVAVRNLRRWLRGLDLNQRPSGYEPDELPDCSTPRHRIRSAINGRDEKAAARTMPAAAFETVNGSYPQPPAVMPRGDLLSQCLGTSTIGAAWFHGRVRDGIGWVTGARTTKQ